MALYRAQDGSAQNSAEKQNKKRVRRTSDYQKQAGLFDLRGNSHGSDITELHSGRQSVDLSSSYGGRQSEDPADLRRENRDPGYSRFEFEYEDADSSERPYRERHRVEVNGKETSVQGSGMRGLTGSSSDAGRVVRGNVPSSRRLRDDMLSNQRGSARGGSVRGGDTGNAFSGRGGNTVNASAGRGGNTVNTSAGRSAEAINTSAGRSAGRTEVSSDLFPVYTGRTGSYARGSRDRTAGYSTGTYADVRGGRTGGNSDAYAGTRGTRVTGASGNSGSYADGRSTRGTGSAYADTRGTRVNGTGGNSRDYADTRGTGKAANNRTYADTRGMRVNGAGGNSGSYADGRSTRGTGTGRAYADARGTRITGTGGNSGSYADGRSTRGTGTGRIYADTRGARVTGTGGTGSRYADTRGTAAAQDTRKDWNPDEYLRQNGGLDVDSYDSEYGRKNAAGSGNSVVSRDDPEARARRRRESRKEREKQLRRQYIRLGIGAAVLLFLLVFGVVAAIRIFRGDDTSGGETASLPAQETADTGQETSSDSKKDRKETAPSKDVAEETADQPGAESEAEEQSQESPGREDSQPEKTPENTEEDLQEETEDGLQENENTNDSLQEDTEDILQEDEEDSLQEETAGPDGALAGNGQQSSSEQDPAGTAAGLGGIPAGTGQSVLTEEDLRTMDYVRQDEWNMILVNRWNPLPDGHTVETTTLMNGESIDSRCYSELQAMLNDCAAAGGQPVVCSSYRPHEKQVGLYKDQVDRLLADGLSQEEAEAEAATAVAIPGTSEHELGLAVDICDYNHQILDESQAQTPTQQWLMEHCWDYGFILRYPVDKSDITGIIYEPWHYRYVGAEDARKIHEMNICLEEYLAQQ